MAKLTIEDVRNRVEVTYGGLFELISTEYVNTMIPVDIKCKRCGLVKRIPPNIIKCKPTWCASCDSQNARLDTFSVARRIKEATNGEYELLGEYKNANTSVLVRHNSEKCDNNEYMVKWGNFKSGRRCPKCRTTFAETKKRVSGWEQVFMKELEESGYEMISSETKKKKDKIEINNKNCNHESFLMSPDKFERGQRCPKCLRSTGEEEIAKVLSKNNLRYIEQKRFDDLVYKNRLSFDFAVIDNEDKIIAMIEFDGEQHFRAVDFFGGSDNFEKTKLRDSMKNDYCMKNNIQLLRISYLEFENIESIIIKYFKYIIK